MQYSVQFVVIREVVVDADNDIQAERDAFQKLKAADVENTIASHVSDCSGTDMGALDGDLMEAWKFARENFNTIDYDWLTS